MHNFTNQSELLENGQIPAELLMRVHTIEAALSKLATNPNVIAGFKEQETPKAVEHVLAQPVAAAPTGSELFDVKSIRNLVDEAYEGEADAKEAA